MSCVATTATISDASAGSQTVAPRNTAATATIAATWITSAVDRVAPSCQAMAPGVVFCGVAIGSDTRANRPRKSGHAPRPVTTRASAARTRITTAPATTESTDDEAAPRPAAAPAGP